MTESDDMSAELEYGRDAEGTPCRNRSRTESPISSDTPGAKLEDNSYKPKKSKPSLGADPGSAYTASVAMR